MELYLFRPAEYNRLYNCSNVSINSLIPLDQRREFVPEAWITIALSAIYYPLYLLCLPSLFKYSHKNPCYQILFFIGCLDLIIVPILGPLHGWLTLQGAVFCSHPRLIFCAGMTLNFIWFTVSTSNLILELNRCLEILNPTLSQRLFHGFRTRIWLAFASLYGFYWLFFVKPTIFSSIYFAWLFNPFVGYRPEIDGNMYTVPQYFMHDLAVAILCPSIYVFFCASLMKKQYSYLQGEPEALIKISNSQKMTFLQVFIISGMNSAGCFLYVLMQYFTPSQSLITAAQFLWFHIHAFPPVIYLVFNKTIRNDCRLFIRRLFKRKLCAKNNKVNNKNVIIVLPSTMAMASPNSPIRAISFNFKS